MDSVETKREEGTIDIMHLISRVLLSWKKILIFTVIGCVLGVLWQGMSVKQTTRSEADNLLIDKMKIIALRRERFNKSKDYILTSPFMNLNSNEVFIGEGEYYISGCDDVSLACESFKAVIKNDDIRKELCDILEIKNEADIDRMVRITAEVKNDSLLIGENEISVSNKESGKLSLSIKIYTADEDKAEKGLLALEKKVLALKDTSLKDLTFSVIKLVRDVKIENSPDILLEQNATLDEIDLVYKSVIDAEKALSGDQYAIYSNYILSGKEDKIPVVLFPENPLKKPVILAVLFAFIGLVYYIVAYFCSQKIHIADNVSDIVDKPVFGMISVSRRKLLWIDRTFEKLELQSLPTVVDGGYIASCLKESNISTVVYDEKAKGIVKALEDIKAQMPDVDFIAFSSEDTSSLSKIKKDLNVALLVAMESTNKLRICREAEILASKGAVISGSVLVK